MSCERHRQTLPFATRAAHKHTPFARITLPERHKHRRVCACVLCHSRTVCAATYGRHVPECVCVNSQLTCSHMPCTLWSTTTANDDGDDDASQAYDFLENSRQVARPATDETRSYTTECPQTSTNSYYYTRTEQIGVRTVICGATYVAHAHRTVRNPTRHEPLRCFVRPIMFAHWNITNTNSITHAFNIHTHIQYV